jgi:hypothetical protein
MSKKRKKNSKDSYDEAFEGPGFIMARKGRHILMQGTATPEEHRSILEAIRDSQKETDEDIQAKIQEIENLIRDHDPFDIIAQMSLRNSNFDAENFKEWKSEINPAYTEYIALLCMTQPYESFHFQNPQPIPPRLIEDLQEKVKVLFQVETMNLVFKDVDPDKPGRTTLDRLRFLSLSESLLVRYSAYHHHLVETLLGIFSPIKLEMENSLGFNISDAIGILEGVDGIRFLKLYQRRAEAIEYEQKLREAAKDYRHRKRAEESGTEFPKELLEKVTKEKSSVSKKMIRNMVTAWTFYTLGETLSFTVDELAGFTQLPSEKIAAFLNRFSLTFEGIEERYRRPAPTHPLMRKPFIKHGNQYLCPVPQSAYWAIRPEIEDLWNPQSKTSIVKDDGIWQKYQKVRADYVESAAIQYLNDALKFATSYQGVKYDLVNERGEKVEAELDGLLLLDTAIFLVEAKSGMLTEQARRGAKKGMKDDVERLVEEAHAQALRAKKYIQTAEKPVFRLSNGQSIVIDKSKHNEIYLITVSLDDLSVFVTNTNLLRDLGFLKGGEYPWAVSLTDLKVISEIAEFSSQFVHYIQRRLHLIELGWVNAHDELDWFGHYLLEGLYFDNLKKKKDDKFIYNLLSYSWIFDDYYSSVTGQRQTPVEKPLQKMPKLMHEILDELDKHHYYGYLKTAYSLLDMSGEARTDLFKTCEKLRKKTQKDREIHSYTLAFNDGSFGFAYFFTPSEQKHRFPKHIANYSMLKKYQTKFYRWVTIACITDTPGWVDYLVVIEGAWEFNELLDKGAKEFLQPWDDDKKE